MEASDTKPNARIGWAAFALGLFLLAVYALTFAGVFRSIDELAMAGLTENLVQAGSFETPLVRFAKFHNGVGEFEPGYSLMAAPLYWLARQLPQTSNFHAVMLLNPILTATSGGLLYYLSRRLGYGAGASVGLGLTFGLGTMAWPYSKSFLREPLVAILWLVSFVGLASFIERPRAWIGIITVVLAVMSVLVKVTSVVVVPVMFGLMALALFRNRGLPSWRVMSLGSGAATAIVLLAYALLNQRGYSLGSLLSSLVAEPFSLSGLIPWYGLLLSPGKGLFIYSPVLVLSLLGWPRFFKRHRLMAVGVLATSVVVLFSLRAHQSWWGGLTWGPRFLVPLLPLLALPILEMLERHKWAWGVVGLSTGYQAIVSSSAWPVAYRGLLGVYYNPEVQVGLDWSRWKESPAFQIVFNWGKSSLDLAWLYSGLAGEAKLDIWLAAVLAANFIVTAGVVWMALTNREPGIPLVGGLLSSMVAIASLVFRAYLGLPDYPGLSASDAREMARRVSSSEMGVKRLLYVSPDFGTYPWLGLVKGEATTSWISPADEGDFAPLLPNGASATFAAVVDRPHIASIYPGDVLVSWLNAHSYRLRSDWVGGYEIFFYANPPAELTERAVSIEWPNGIGLVNYSFQSTVRAGSALAMRLTLTCLSEECGEADSLFTHLVSQDGAVISGEDGLVQYGNLAAEGWPSGEGVTDRRGIWVPADASPGEYALVVGFAKDGGYVPVTLDSGEIVDYVDLAQVDILRGP